MEIYVKTSCPYSRALKRKLEHDGTSFIEHDVEVDRAALQRMLRVNGGLRQVPKIVASDDVIVGFHGT